MLGSKFALTAVLSFLALPASAMVQEGYCAIVVASRPPVAEVELYERQNPQLNITKVYEASNGWYAISIGQIPLDGSEAAVDDLIRRGSVPSDTYCSRGDRYVGNLTRGPNLPAPSTNPAFPDAVSLPASAGMVRDGFCAIVVASRTSFAEVDLFAREDPYLRITDVYEADNAWFAVSTGQVPLERFKQTLEELKRQGLVPGDSYCSRGQNYVRGVTYSPTTVGPVTQAPSDSPPAPSPSPVVAAPLPGHAEWDDRFAPFYINTSDPTSLHLDGPIDARSALAFSRALDEVPDARTLVLSSPGGDVYSALLIAREVDRRGLATLIPEGSVCYSACSYLYVAGHQRGAEGSLGVHQISSDNPDLVSGQIALSDIVEILNDFSVPNDLIVLMLRTPPEDMYVLTPEELSRYGLIGARTARATPAAPPP